MVEAGGVPVALPATLTSSEAPVLKEQVVEEVLARLGLLVSTAVRTQTQAMQMSFFFLMPNILLSGFMFPREAMPGPAQWLGALLPLTYYLRILRGILLRGGGTVQLWPESLALVGFALALVVLSVRRFSKTIE